MVARHSCLLHNHHIIFLPVLVQVQVWNLNFSIVTFSTKNSELYHPEHSAFNLNHNASSCILQQWPCLILSESAHFTVNIFFSSGHFDVSDVYEYLEIFHFRKCPFSSLLSILDNSVNTGTAIFKALPHLPAIS